MSGAIVTALAIGAAATAVLVIMLLGLYRHLKVLLDALKQYRDDMDPALTEIRTAADAARRRAESVPSRLPTGLPGRKPGVRLGR